MRKFKKQITILLAGAMIAMNMAGCQQDAVKETPSGTAPIESTGTEETTVGDVTETGSEKQEPEPLLSYAYSQTEDGTEKKSENDRVTSDDSKASDECNLTGTDKDGKKGSGSSSGLSETCDDPVIYTEPETEPSINEDSVQDTEKNAEDKVFNDDGSYNERFGHGTEYNDDTDAESEPDLTGDKSKTESGEGGDSWGDSEGESEADTAALTSAYANTPLRDYPEYNGKPSIIVNDGEPFFMDGDVTLKAYEYYPELDELGRCGACMACLGKELMPTEKRGNIGMVKPSGWSQAKYPDVIEDLYLWNRCHLIAFMLAGENDNTKNLITGTRYMNTEGMLPYESEVSDYIRKTDNHVLYRVTPVFQDEELVARGVLIEARSVEDDGLKFCVFCYNVQPGIEIDYATGKSHESADNVTEADSESETENKTKNETGDKKGTGKGDKTGTNAGTDTDTGKTGTVTQETDNSKGSKTVNGHVVLQDNAENADFVVNINSHKFHELDCGSAAKISHKNKRFYKGNKQDLINDGYEAANCCNP